MPPPPPLFLRLFRVHLPQTANDSGWECTLRASASLMHRAYYRDLYLQLVRGRPGQLARSANWALARSHEQRSKQRNKRVVPCNLFCVLPRLTHSLTQSQFVRDRQLRREMEPREE